MKVNFIYPFNQINIDERNGEKVKWDIKRVMEIIENNNIESKEIKIAEYYSEDDGVDMKHIMDELDNSPIVVTDVGSSHVVIDGKHRIFKAKIRGEDMIMAYNLPQKYHKDCILDYDENVYEKYNKN